MEVQKPCVEFVLSQQEKVKLVKLIYKVMIEFSDPAESLEYIDKEVHDLISLTSRMDEFFFKNPGQYFIRTNECSPKDAYYQLHNDEEYEDDEPQNLSLVRKTLSALRVSDTKHVIRVLTHSERMYDSIVRNPDCIIQLFKWRDDFYHETETRCFIIDNKLVGLTRYHSFEYPEWLNLHLFKEMIIDNVKRYCETSSLTETTYSLDVGLTHEKKLLLIEKNPFDEYLDLGLFNSRVFNNTVEFRASEELII